MMFEELIGKPVKVRYRDGDGIRTAYGTLESEEKFHIKIMYWDGVRSKTIHKDDVRLLKPHKGGGF